MSHLGEVIGTTGRRYLFKQLIQDKPDFGRVWSGQGQFLLKDVSKTTFSNFREKVWPQLPECSNIRLPLDTISDQRILVFKYMDDDFLSLVKKQIPMQGRKQILKAVLKGIAELHDRNVVHLDIKPDNIMADYRQDGQDTIIEHVQLIDLENAVYLPKPMYVKGNFGNRNWRSPEAHFRGVLNQPTDIFSFGAVCIYAMLGRVIFGYDDDFQKHEALGALPLCIRLQRQVSYFGDQGGVDGLMRIVSEEEVNCEVLRALWENRTEEHFPYKPFSDWPDVTDAEFKDVVRKMMNLDPFKRITASQALEHPWFKDSVVT